MADLQAALAEAVKLNQCIISNKIFLSIIHQKGA